MSSISPDAEARLTEILSRVCDRFESDMAERIRHYWHKAWYSFERSGALPQLLSLPEVILSDLPLIALGSDFVISQIARSPEAFLALVNADALTEKSKNETQTGAAHATDLPAYLGEDWLALPDSEFDLKLRRYRNQAYIRIIWRDLMQRDDLWTTMADLSGLADAMIQAACTYHHHQMALRYGQPLSRAGEPQALVVLGMGKLGACELNLSSDIDLIFAYPELGETTGHPETGRNLMNQEFFVKVGQRVIQSISKVGAEGFVFRVDMRLRPFGDSGELVLHYDALETYYQDHGRPWERYALIKARPITGAPGMGEKILNRLRPFVYRRYIDYSAVEELREMKAMIHREVLRRGDQNNIKIGLGGIREIEFIAQVCQLIRGGQQRELQQRALRTVLRRLDILGLLPEDAVVELEKAYVFLRASEHRLQALGDQQTHSLPSTPNEGMRLAALMGFVCWEDYLKALDGHRQRVRHHFEALIQPPEAPASPEDDANAALLQAWWLCEITREELSGLLPGLDQETQAACIEQVCALQKSVSQKRPAPESRERLDRLMPMLLRVCVQQSDVLVVLKRVLPIIGQILRRSAYLLLLIEHPAALTRLVELCALSPWLAEYLFKFPVLLDELLYEPENYVKPDFHDLDDALRQQLMRVLEDDLENQMEILRQFKNTHVFHVAVCEIQHRMHLKKVSDYLTDVAQVVLKAIFEIASAQIAQRLNVSRQKLIAAAEQHFAVAAFGKMGGFEMSYGSDLDLIFLYDLDPLQPVVPEISMESTVFFTRLTQRMIHMLSTATHSGRLYEVDTRLRPAGESGMLVNTMSYLERYLKEEAWTWEHQAIVRARVVVGGDAMRQRFDAIRRYVLCQHRPDLEVRKDVQEMRQKMIEHLGSAAGAETFNIKQDPGGIVDIEFIVQFGVLRYAAEYADMAVWTDTVRILETLATLSLLSQADADTLTQAYIDFRSSVHLLVLQNRKPNVALAVFERQREAVRAIWEAFVVGETVAGG